MRKSAATEAPTSRGALLTALAISLVVSWVVPFGRYLMYPFTLLGTWVHEMGHGLAALAVGGTFASLDVFANASGLAHTTNGPGARDAIVCAAGLLAAPLLGGAVLAFARGPRRARLVLFVLGAAMLVSLVLWVRSLAGWVSLPLVGLLVGGVARFGSPRERMLLAQFLGLRLAADTLSGADYLFARTATIDGRELPSDISRVAAALGGSYIVWGLLVAAVSSALLGAGLWAAWRRRAAAPLTSR